MALLACTMVIATLAVGGAARGGDWKLAWSDEFDVDGLPAPAKWTCEGGRRLQAGNYRGGGSTWTIPT